MPKTYGPVTERLLNLALGRSCVVTQKRIDYSAARKHAPERDWWAESRDGGWVVTRVR
ncbi:hypothetical protein [Phenylobacterium sp.]|uniref:hypothetical protein n=1 Tax=Phenylobacterium sp. TaxID=1871053 RepID=UPI0025FF298D|nr:hypothetical protein [Phenylobacterium sp.]